MSREIQDACHRPRVGACGRITSWESPLHARDSPCTTRRGWLGLTGRGVAGRGRHGTVVQRPEDIPRGAFCASYRDQAAAGTSSASWLVRMALVEQVVPERIGRGRYEVEITWSPLGQA